MSNSTTMTIQSVECLFSLRKEVSYKHGAAVEGLNRALRSTCAAQYHYWPDEDKISFLDRRLELARHLLQHGANPNYRDDESNPPLKQAVAVEDCKLALLLLEYGADPTETDEDGGTLLEFARTDSMIEILHEWISKSCHPKQNSASF